jgi:hypothetical protein
VVKLDGAAIAGMYTGTIHVNVMPIGKAIDKVDWPPYVIPKGFEHLKLKYKICEHEKLPPDTAFCRSVCHKMKPCACDEHEARKANKKPKLDGGSFLAMVKAKAAAKKLETCPHYLRGRCTYARLAALTQCGYCHPADPPAKNIVCSLKRGKEGICSNGRTCVFAHLPAEADMDDE